jgi:hypothetical protein
MDSAHVQHRTYRGSPVMSQWKAVKSVNRSSFEYSTASTSCSCPCPCSSIVPFLNWMNGSCPNLSCTGDRLGYAFELEQ